MNIEIKKQHTNYKDSEKGGSMDTKTNSLRVLMLPWLAHGHISPFLELAKKLSKYNFYIYILSTPINLFSIKDKVSTKTFPSIQLVEIHLPSLPNLPPHYHTTKSLPPHLMPTLKKALDMVQPSFTNLLISLKPDLVIYDFIQPWAPEIASHHNIPAIYFSIIGAASCSYLYHLSKTPSLEFPFRNMYFEEYDLQKIAKMINHKSSDKSDGERFIECIERSSEIVLVKTSEVIEAKYVDHLSYIKLVLPVGPLLPEDATDTNTNYDGKPEESFMSWLDKRDACSVVFVSFGSEYFMSREEIEEIAYGLELCSVSFVWVIRFHEEEKEKDVEQVLPKGFLERVGDRGLVVEGWAPQVNILQHSSIVGFVSHCGWSSVMEGIRYGVPIIAMPMQLDQPLNTRLVVDDHGVGLEVKRKDGGKLDRAEIAKVIKVVVVDKKGEEIKKKMMEISEKMRGDREIEVVVDKLMKLCQKTDHLQDLLEQSQIGNGLHRFSCSTMEAVLLLAVATLK